jgi:CubicO group peptidase (beta-lactamase class C family)
LIGEVVRRITGQSLGRFFAEQIAGPLNADFLIGVPDSEFHRIGNLIPPPDGAVLGQGAVKDSIPYRTYSSPRTSALDSHTDGWRRAEIPAANGHSNARAVAKIHSALANGGRVGDVQLLSPEICRSVMQTRIEGMDLVFGGPMAFGLGFGLHPVKADRRNLCFWGGWGGSRAIIDQDNALSFAYVMNKMADGLLGDARGDQLARATFMSLAAMSQ